MIQSTIQPNKERRIIKTNPLVRNIKTIHDLLEVCRRLGSEPVRGHVLVKIGMVSGSHRMYRYKPDDRAVARVGKKSGNGDGAAPKKLTNNLWRRFELKPGGRMLTIPASSDLVDIHKMLAPIFKNVEVSNHSWAYVSGRGPVDAAWTIAKTKPSFIWREDVKGFFPSVKTSMIRKYLVQHLGWSDSVANTVASVCTFQGELPQGSILSPDISNVIAADMHDELADFSEAHGIKYLCYSDDLYFYGDLTKEQDDALWAEIKGGIKSIVKKHRFILNFEKCARRREGLQVLSMFIKNGYVVPDGKTESLYRAILLAYLDPSKTPHIDGKEATAQMILGKAAWLVAINKKRFFETFGKYIQKLKNWYPDTWHELSKFFPVDFRTQFFNVPEAEVDEREHFVVGG